ncbi:uncharacterized protein LOC142345925 [Convolutriloba macropyga]|uniref:uncharacterized protein LOC142345925 n=1 Tax=Convolutriloba macropyga TaxID=536237 RepID=UPI003F520921
MFQLLILFACILLSVISEAEGGQCEENSTLVNLGGGSSRCFGLLLQQGLVSRNEALRQCRSHFRDPSLPQSISTKAELNKLLEYAISAGLPLNNQSGFWTMYFRTRRAPMPLDGPLTQSSIDTRRNRSRFIYISSSFATMPESLWRNETQPGNALDERDEQCTAQSRPGRQPEYLGIDDYECDGKTLHYILCEVEFVR